MEIRELSSLESGRAKKKIKKKQITNIMKELKQGRYTGITSHKYHSIGQVMGPEGHLHTPASKSMLTTFIKNPRAWKMGLGGFKGSKSADMGSLIDAMCLEPGILNSEFIVRPETYIHPKDGEKTWNANAAVCKKWINETAKGKTVISPKDWEIAQTAKQFLLDNEFTREAIEKSDTQVMYVREHEGIYIKSLFDMCPRADSKFSDSIIDMKRTVASNPKEFYYECLKYKYHVQAALYLDTHNIVTGEDRQKFYFVLSESQAPYGEGMIEMDQDFIQKGREEYQYMINEYVKCVKSGSFPSPYSKGPVMMSYKQS